MFSKEVIDLSQAIAHAEGFGVPDAVPTRAHNPGDLKLSGYPTTGAENIAIFPDDEAGWKHLYNQINLIKMGLSHVYYTNMTLEEMAKKWTDTANTAWLDNVLWKLQNLGYTVTKDMTLGEFLFGQE